MNSTETGHHSAARAWLRALYVLFLGAALALPPSPVRAALPDPDDAEYVIRPGDVLQLVVWKEPELSRDVTVRLDGRITVPLLGDVDAAGRTPAKLGEDLGRRLTKFVATPVVTVAVSQANSSRVYVLGQVVQPGAFPLTGRMTVVQALALAGGFKEFAKTDRIVVLREDSPKGRPIPVNYKRV